jgi:hypothetical protein
MRDVNQVIAALPSPPIPELPAPWYSGPVHSLNEGWPLNVGLAVESMARHTTDEGWQLFQGLEAGGYELFHRGRGTSQHVPTILRERHPTTLVIQDKREWMGLTAGPGFDEAERFVGVEALKERDDIFKLTIVKDSQHDAPFHRRAADEIGCHAWVVYYHPRIVKHLAPYVRERHLVRTWHSLDSRLVLPFDANRADTALLSGAISGAYPLRTRLFEWARRTSPPFMRIMQHPGYGRNGCFTPGYIAALGRHKVAVCTSSIYGYALRKIVEATACGCYVLTDLPIDDVMPEIDDNLVRVPPNIPTDDAADLIRSMIDAWEPERQRHFAERAQNWYDYRNVGKRLAHDIEQLRGRCNVETQPEESSSEFRSPD